MVELVAEFEVVSSQQTALKPCNVCIKLVMLVGVAQGVGLIVACGEKSRNLLQRLRQRIAVVVQLRYRWVSGRNSRR